MNSATPVPTVRRAPARAASCDSRDVTDRTDDNLVFLRGRLADNARVVTLPSGDELWSFRLVVDRPAGERGRVDALECVTTAARVRRSVMRAAPGDVLEITGSLRRRFFRVNGSVASRYEVTVRSARITSRQRNGAGPARTRASA